MKQLALYFAYQIKKSWFMLACMGIIPVLIPYIVFGIFAAFLNTPEQLSATAVDVPLLPKMSRVSYNGTKLNYFAFAPDNNYSRTIINELLRANKQMDKVNVRGFDSFATLERYINIKNIIPFVRQKFENNTLLDSVLCKDIKRYFNTTDCSNNLQQNLSQTLKQVYNLEDADFDYYQAHTEEFEEDILFAINFHTVDSFRVAEQKNITYEFVYNSTILDSTIVNYPDSLSKQFGNIQRQPFWTGYTFTLQKQIDEITVKLLTELDYEINYGRLDQLDNINMTIGTFFEITSAMALGVFLIFVILLGSQNRGKNHLVLRRLGVKEWEFWLANSVYVFAPTLLFSLMMGIIWHFGGNAMFIYSTLGFTLFQMVNIAFLFTTCSIFISALLGNSPIGSVVSACLLAFFFLIIPSIFHTVIFYGVSFFDPSLTPQWLIWLVMFLVPPFQSMGIIDSFTSVIADRYLSINRFEWKTDKLLIGLEYLFTDLNKYTSVSRQCAKASSKFGVDGFDNCRYYQPSYGLIFLLVSVEGILLWGLSLIIYYCKTEVGHRGINIKDLFSKRLWKRQQINIVSQLNIKNLQVSFKTRSCQKQVTYFQKFSKNRDIVLKNINYVVEEGQITALVGESSSGKSTILRFLAGELMSHFTKTVNNLKIDDVDQDYVNHNYLLQHGTLDEINQFFANIDEQTYCIFEQFDLKNSVDANIIKPFIGFCPQDFSNVWMDMSCYQNVKFSLLLRTESQGFSVPEKYDEFIQIVLAQLELNQSDILQRKAKHLSGGMLRRLALCNAVVGNPKLLLLDEVSAGVDPVFKRMIWDILKLLPKNVAVVLTTHDMGEIAEIAQRLTIIDKGFSLLTNASPFDLRSKESCYSVKFYHSQPVCSFEVAKAIKQRIHVSLKCDLQKIVIDSVAPHSIQYSLKQNVNDDNILSVITLLEDLKDENSFSDFIINKSKLDDIYIRYIDYERITQQQQENSVDSQIIQSKAINHPLLHRFLATFKSLFLRDFYTQIPVFLYLCIVCVVMVLISFWLKNLLSEVFQTLNKEYLATFRYQDSASSCFWDCSQLYSEENITQEAIETCMIKRPPQVFEKQNLDYRGSKGACGYYLTYLGLDIQQPHFVSIGDFRYQALYGIQSFGYNGKSRDRKDWHNFVFQDYDENIIFKNSSIIFDEMTPQFSYNDDNVIIKNLIPSYLLFEMGVNQSECYFDCDRFEIQFDLCQESFNVVQCYQKCDEIYAKNGTERLTIMPNAYEMKDFQQFLEIYRQYMKHNSVENPDLMNFRIYTRTQELKRVQEIQKMMMLGYIDIVEQQYYQQGKSLIGRLLVNYTTFLPNRGTTQTYYYLNGFYSKSHYGENYGCKGKWFNETIQAGYYVPHQLGSHEPPLTDGSFGQILPDKDSVILFDIVNQPLTQIAGSLLRQAKGSNDIFYSIVSRQMPKFVSTDIQQVSSVSQDELINSVCNMQLTVTGLLPIMYTGLHMGLESELKIPRLFKLHFTTNTQHILCSFVYYCAIALVLAIINIVLVLIFIPDTYFLNRNSGLNALFYILECIEGVPTGMIIAFLCRKGKNAAIISFFIMLSALLFSILSFGDETFTYIVMIILPCYSQYYEIYLNGLNAPINWNIFVVGIFIAIFYVLLMLLMSSIDQIRSKCKNIRSRQSTVSSEVQNLVENSREQLSDTELWIKDISMTYRTGTHALKSVNLQIPKHQVFGLLGSNGSGKSTLMHCLSGIYTPQEGNAILPSHCIDLLQVANNSQYFSIVPQHDIFWPNLTVLQHLQLIQDINALPEQVSTDYLLDTLQLREHQHQIVETLSGGLKRRLSIAMAMTTVPVILALDEPSTGLGLTTKRFVHQAILQVLHSSSNSTLLLTSHDMEEVEALVDYCCIMYNGVVLKVGTIGELRHQCSVQFELSLRLDDPAKYEMMQKYLENCNVVSSRYNEITDNYIFQIGQGCSVRQVVEALREASQLQCPWILEVVRMEHVFMNIVQQYKDSIV